MARPNPQQERQLIQQRQQCQQLARVIRGRKDELRGFEAKIRAQRETVEAARELLRNAQNYYEDLEAHRKYTAEKGLLEAMMGAKGSIQRALMEATNDYRFRGCRSIL